MDATADGTESRPLAQEDLGNESGDSKANLSYAPRILPYGHMDSQIGFARIESLYRGRELFLWILVPLSSQRYGLLGRTDSLSVTGPARRLAKKLAHGCRKRSQFGMIRTLLTIPSLVSVPSHDKSRNRTGGFVLDVRFHDIIWA